MQQIVRYLCWTCFLVFWSCSVNRRTTIVEAATSVSVGKVSENESHDHGRVFEPAAFDFTHFASEADALGSDIQFCDCFVYQIIVRVCEARVNEYQCAVLSFIMNPAFKDYLRCGNSCASHVMKSFKKCSSEAPVISCKLTSISRICCWIIQMAKFYNCFSHKSFYF